MPDESLKDLSEYVSEKLEKRVVSADFEKDELVFTVKADDLLDVLQFLRDDRECSFTTLLDVCGVDYPNRPERFEVVYILLSLKENNRARVRVSADEETQVPSAVELFNSALWYEREVWDMYGVMFSGNPDLRRILTDYGFDGHPQRKDFPLTGYVELRYDEELKRVVYEPVKLQQDFRVFDNLSPWEGMTDVMLPGDEKASIPTGWKGEVEEETVTEEEQDVS